MPHDPDFHATAAAWLNGTDDDGAQRVPRHILRDAPDSAMEFAALARAEAVLQLAAFSPAERLARARKLIDPSAPSRVWRLIARPAIRYSAAAMVVLAGVAWWLWPRGTESEINLAKFHIAPRVLPAEAPGLITPTPPEGFSPADKAFVRRMSRFIVPEFKATGVPLADALEILRKDIADIDDSAVPDFSAGPELPDDLNVHLHLRYLPVAVLVDVLAIQTGTKFQPSGKGYRITEHAKAPMPGVPQELTYRATQVEQLPFGSGKWHENSPPASEFLALGLDQCLGEKPVNFGADPQGTNSGHVTASNRLHKMLRRLTAGSATPPGTWTWIVKAVEITGAESQTKFIELAGETPGRVFRDPEFQVLMRSMSQTKGLDLMTFPSMITQAGDSAHSFVGTLGSDPTSVAIMRVQLGSLLKLQGEELIRGAMELGVQNSTLQKVYPEYQSEIAHLAEAKKSGWGPRHPKVLGLEESIRLKKLQLTEAAEAYTSNLKRQIENSNAMLAGARVPTEDWTGVRWIMENQTVGDSESMFQWLLEVSEPKPGTPPARSMSRGNGRLLDHQTLMVHCERTAEGKLRAFFITGNTVDLEKVPVQKVQPQEIPSSLSPPNPDSSPEPKENLPYGIPVVGRAGFVYSPYVEGTDKLVDISGIKRGTRIRCPFTNKHFRVP